MPSERVVALNQMIIQTRLFYFLKSARYVSNKSNKFCSPVHHNKLYSMPLLYLYTTNLGGGLESITFLSGNTNNGYPFSIENFIRIYGQENWFLFSEKQCEDIIRSVKNKLKDKHFETALPKNYLCMYDLQQLVRCLLINKNEKHKNDIGQF